MTNELCLPLQDLEPLKEIIKDSSEHYGHYRIEYYKYGTQVCVSQIAYEEERFNQMTEQELEIYSEGLDENQGLPVKHTYNAHVTITLSNDGTLHLNSIKVGETGKGYGNKILDWIENYAKSKGLKGILICSTESPVMNHLAVKRGYRPIYSTVEERIAFERELGFRHDLTTEIEYDDNGHVFGYYQLNF